MNNATILIKVKNRLNKLASNDYTNLDSWIIVEAFNKGQLQWCRRNLHATNLKQEGTDQSTPRLDDFQTLLTPTQKFTFVKNDIYDSTTATMWPKDYMRFERVSLTVVKECCPKPKRMTVYLGEESNVDVLLNDPNKSPDYAWGHTFAILFGDRIDIYHNDKFDIAEAKLIYYRQPRRIQITGVVDLPTNTVPSIDIECEFSDDLIELLVDEAADILAGDIGSWDQKQRLSESVEKNN